MSYTIKIGLANELHFNGQPIATFSSHLHAVPCARLACKLNAYEPIMAAVSELLRNAHYSVDNESVTPVSSADLQRLIDAAQRSYVS